MDWKWNSVEQVVTDLELDERSADLPKVLEIIKIELAEIHPDKTGGEFKSDTQEKRYHKLNQARCFIEHRIKSPPGNEMITVDAANRLIETLNSAMHVYSSADREEKIQKKAYSSIQKKYAFPKFTSLTLFLITTAIISFAGGLEDHPIYLSVTKEFVVSYEKEQLENYSKGAVTLAYMAHFAESLSRYAESESVAENEMSAAIIASQGKSIVDFWKSGDEIMLFNQAVSSSIFLGHTLDSDFYRTIHGFEIVAKTATNIIPHLPAESKSIDVSRLSAELSTRSASLTNAANTISEEARNVVNAKVIRNVVPLWFLFGILFAVSWLREKSDQTWAEYITSNPGLLEIRKRLREQFHVNHEISISMFESLVREKNVPWLLALILGKRVTSVGFSKIVDLIAERLAEKNIIEIVDQGLNIRLIERRDRNQKFD